MVFDKLFNFLCFWFICCFFSQQSAKSCINIFNAKGVFLFCCLQYTCSLGYVRSRGTIESEVIPASLALASVRHLEKEVGL